MGPRIGIIGGGYGGLIAALRLRQAGYDDIVILERAHEVGGAHDALQRLTGADHVVD